MPRSSVCPFIERMSIKGRGEVRSGRMHGNPALRKSEGTRHRADRGMRSARREGEAYGEGEDTWRAQRERAWRERRAARGAHDERTGERAEEAHSKKKAPEGRPHMRLFALRGAKKRLKTPPRRRRRRITLRRKGFPRERLPTEGSPRQERDLRRERGLRHKRNLQPSSAADAAASARVRRHRGNACMSWYHKAHATPLPAHKRNRYGLPFRPCPHASARRAHTRPRWHGVDERDTGRPRTREARFRKAHVHRTRTCKERAHRVRLRRAHVHGAGACRTRIRKKRIR